MVDDDPVVVGANRYRFAPGERILNARVMSVSFIWVISGTGEIEAAGRRFAVDGQHVVRLPWHHSVEYRASTRRPFHVGTLHVVPHHTPGTAVVPRVAHLPGDPLIDDPARTGDPQAFRPSCASTRNDAARRIVELGTIAIERFVVLDFDERYFRALGRMVLLENLVWSSAPSRTPAMAASGTFDLMTTFIRHHLAEPLTVARVADSARCSPTTAQRLFARHGGESMQSWIRGTRLREAAALLRTTGLRVGEVAQLVGYPDPLYFSRAFRRAYGVAPSRFAQSILRP